MKRPGGLTKNRNSGLSHWSPRRYWLLDAKPRLFRLAEVLLVSAQTLPAQYHMVPESSYK